MIGKWPCQNLMGGTGAAIYAPDENGLCDHAECEPPSNPKPVKQHEWEKVWVITEWDEGIVDYETGGRDADPIEWECRTMYSEAVYDRDIKALEARCAEQAKTIARPQNKLRDVLGTIDGLYMESEPGDSEWNCAIDQCVATVKAALEDE